MVLEKPPTKTVTTIFTLTKLKGKKGMFIEKIILLNTAYPSAYDLLIKVDLFDDYKYTHTHNLDLDGRK